MNSTHKKDSKDNRAMKHKDIILHRLLVCLFFCALPASLLFIAPQQVTFSFSSSFATNKLWTLTQIKYFVDIRRKNSESSNHPFLKVELSILVKFPAVSVCPYTFIHPLLSAFSTQCHSIFLLHKEVRPNFLVTLVTIFFLHWMVQPHLSSYVNSCRVGKKVVPCFHAVTSYLNILCNKFFDLFKAFL